MSDRKPITATEVRFRRAVFDADLEELGRRINETRDHALLTARARGAFKLDSPLYSAFANALQCVLERHLPDDREKAARIWLAIQDLPELGAIVRDEAKHPSPPLSDEGTKE